MRWLGQLCIPDKDDSPDFVFILWTLWFNLFHLTMLYFVFGILEVYRSVNQIWENGLVLDNYHGIIDLICQPLERAEAPRDVVQLSLKRDEFIEDMNI